MNFHTQFLRFSHTQQCDRAIAEAIDLRQKAYKSCALTTGPFTCAVQDDAHTTRKRVFISSRRYYLEEIKKNDNKKKKEKKGKQTHIDYHIVLCV